MANAAKISQNIFNLVSQHFGGDSKQTWRWFENPNPAFGYEKPMKLIRNGKANKILNFLLSQNEFNLPYSK